MRKTSSTILGLGMAILLTAPAMAQESGGRGGRGGFGGMMGGGASLLSNRGVQQELKLDAEQTERVASLARDLAEKRREQFSSLRDASPEERQSMMRKSAEETREALAKILKPEQVKRYHQIELQQQGLQAFLDPEVRDRLKLTESQRSKIRDMAENLREETREAFQDSEGSVQERVEKLRTLRTQSMEKATALLEDDQKASLKEVFGAPYEVKFEGGPGGGGAGGRRRPGGDR